MPGTELQVSGGGWEKALPVLAAPAQPGRHRLTCLCSCTRRGGQDWLGVLSGPQMSVCFGRAVAPVEAPLRCLRSVSSLGRSRLLLFLVAP